MADRHHLVSEGTDVVVFLQRVLVPALHRIGDGWHQGALPIWSEHRGSAIAERVVAELAPNPRGRRRGVVVVAAISGDHHSLPTTMATVALRDANWQVHHLGADTPVDEMVRFGTAEPVDLAVLTVTNPDSAAIAEQTADTCVRRHPDDRARAQRGHVGVEVGDERPVRLLAGERHLVEATELAPPTRSLPTSDQAWRL